MWYNKRKASVVRAHPRAMRVAHGNRPPPRSLRGQEGETERCREFEHFMAQQKSRIVEIAAEQGA